MTGARGEDETYCRPRATLRFPDNPKRRPDGAHKLETFAMPSRLAKWFTFLLAAVIATTAAHAQTLYSATGGNANSNLNIINPATGALVTVVGPIGFAVTGLAVHPSTGVLYGVTSGQSPSNPRSLITINKTTGAGTLVGALGLNNPVADITFNPSGTLFGWSEDTDDLVTINTATGVATVVGDSGLSTFGSGLASNASGVLFYAGDGANQELRTVNPGTGLTTVVATMTGSPQGDAVPALAFNPNNALLYGLDGLDGNPNVTLITINTVTGAVTTVGATLQNTDAIAFDAAAAAAVSTPIPTLSETGVLLLALLMGAMGAFAYSRRKGA